MNTEANQREQLTQFLDKLNACAAALEEHEQAWLAALISEHAMQDVRGYGVTNPIILHAATLFNAPTVGVHNTGLVPPLHFRLSGDPDEGGE